MSVGALEQDLASFHRGEYARERIEAFEMCGRLPAVAQQRQQFLKTGWRLLRAQDDLAPLFESVRCGVTVGEPTIDVLQRDAQQRLAGSRISPLQFVGDQFVQGHAIFDLGFTICDLRRAASPSLSSLRSFAAVFGAE